MGQGAPEADDDIVGSFPRPTTIPIDSAAREYGPTAGIKSLRAAVARLYNDQYRKGKESQYTWENVCIVPGGRAGLIRIAAILGNSYLSFPIPDYTAYSEMLSLFKNVCQPIYRLLETKNISLTCASSRLFLSRFRKVIIIKSTLIRLQKRLLEVPRCF